MYGPCTTKRPLESIAIDILGPQPKTRHGCRYLLVMTDRFTKLTQVVALRTVTTYKVAVAFCEAWAFKYGIPETLLSDNGPQFTARFFQSVCQVLGVTNLFTSAYHPQTNGQTERYNRTIVTMLRNYVNEQQNDWDRYASALTYAYNCHVHRSTQTTPFDLVLSRPPPELSLHHTSRKRTAPDVQTRNDFIPRLDATIRKAYRTLRKTQARYKRDFDKWVRSVRGTLKPGDYVFLDATDGITKTPKLQSPAVGPHKVLANEKRTVTIDRDGITERVAADRCVYSPAPTGAAAEVPTTTAEELAGKVRDGPVYTVEKLVRHRTGPDGTLEFLVKWAGYTEPTWEPRKHIPEELISRYAARTKRRHGKRLTDTER